MTTLLESDSSHLGHSAEGVQVLSAAGNGVITSIRWAAIAS
jgi:hypothetical protein